MTKLHEEGLIKTRIRLWTADTDRYERTPSQWLALVKGAREGRGLSLDFEDHNLVLDAGMTTLASILNADQAVWQNGAIYTQALGTATTSLSRVNTGLDQEIFRKKFTEKLRSGRVITANTFFGALDFATHVCTVTAATTPTTTAFSVSATTGVGPPATALRIGDYLRVQLSSGYEYVTISNLVGNIVTVTPALSIAPATSATVNQLVEEASMFGDLPANFNSSTVTVANGSPTVTLAAGSFANQLAVGDQFRLATERTWYTVSAVGTTTITLSTNYVGTGGAGLAYWLRGTGYNRVNGLRYIKSPVKGFVFENQWTMGG